MPYTRSYCPHTGYISPRRTPRHLLVSHPLRSCHGRRVSVSDRQLPGLGDWKPWLIVTAAAVKQINTARRRRRISAARGCDNTSQDSGKSSTRPAARAARFGRVRSPLRTASPLQRNVLTRSAHHPGAQRRPRSLTRYDWTVSQITIHQQRVFLAHRHCCVERFVRLRIV